MDGFYDGDEDDEGISVTSDPQPGDESEDSDDDK